ncbi:unnamed protein product [Mesocestoides corti]|uniref:Uncharacterized protein n=2 Tax=Mesocestoides corti TaxID=53468 RepID=A0A0R3UCM0_MESCO|nr:unnamed protein product [Mesocestoides corti]
MRNFCRLIRSRASTKPDVSAAVELHLKLVGLTPPQGFSAVDLDQNDESSAMCNPTRQNTITTDESSLTDASYYRYASDVNLPWRVHATLRWALVCCVRQFGDHLRVIQMDAKQKRKLEQLWNTLPGGV